MTNRATSGRACRLQERWRHHGRAGGVRGTWRRVLAPSNTAVGVSIAALTHTSTAQLPRTNRRTGRGRLHWRRPFPRARARPSSSVQFFSEQRVTFWSRTRQNRGESKSPTAAHINKLEQITLQFSSTSCNAIAIATVVARDWGRRAVGDLAIKCRHWWVRSTACTYMHIF
jgi:hypothetical protein